MFRLYGLLIGRLLNPDSAGDDLAAGLMKKIIRLDDSSSAVGTENV